MPFKDPERRREYRRLQSKKRYGPERKEYERERKNKLSIASYNLLPEPERSIKLARNKQRRSLNLRWDVYNWENKW